MIGLEYAVRRMRTISVCFGYFTHTPERVPGASRHKQQQYIHMAINMNLDLVKIPAGLGLVFTFALFTFVDDPVSARLFVEE